MNFSFVLVTSDNHGAMGSSVAFILTLIIIVSMGAEFNKTPKSRNRRHFIFRTENGTEVLRKCTRVCPKGREVSRKCSRHKDTKCSRCKKGTFSTHYSKYCRQCKTCGKGFYEHKSCTALRNTKCRKIKSRCKKMSLTDFKHTAFMLQKPLQKCYRDRSRVNHMTQPICTPGYFISKVEGNDTCVPCTPCRPNEIMEKPCGGRQNTKCGRCREGYFRLQSTNSCARCSLCYGRALHNTRMMDIVVNECDTSKNKSTLYKCFPVYIFQVQVTPTELHVTDALEVNTGDIDKSIGKSKVRNDGEDQGMTSTFNWITAGLVMVLALLIIVLVFVRRQYITQRRKLQDKQETVNKEAERPNSVSFIMDRYIQNMETPSHMKYNSTCNLNIYSTGRMVYEDSVYHSYTDGDERSSTSYSGAKKKRKHFKIKIHNPLLHRAPENIPGSESGLGHSDEKFHARSMECQLDQC